MSQHLLVNVSNFGESAFIECDRSDGARFPPKVHVPCLMTFEPIRLIPPAHQQIYGQRSASLRGNADEGTRRVLSSVNESHHLEAHKSCGGIIVRADALLLHTAESLREFSYRKFLPYGNI